jgi:hypothetical protein
MLPREHLYPEIATVELIACESPLSYLPYSEYPKSTVAEYRTNTSTSNLFAETVATAVCTPGGLYCLMGVHFSGSCPAYLADVYQAVNGVIAPQTLYTTTISTQLLSISGPPGGILCTLYGLVGYGYENRFEIERFYGTAETRFKKVSVDNLVMNVID